MTKTRGMQHTLNRCQSKEELLDDQDEIIVTDNLNSSLDHTVITTEVQMEIP